MHDVLVYALAALVPILIGWVWYSKALFGNAWMRANRFAESDLKGGNMALRLVLSYILSVMVALALTIVVIHQAHLGSIVMKVPGFDDPNSEVRQWLTQSMAKYGGEFRTFKHGAFHGTIAGFFLALPIIGTTALFERRPFKYVAIHAGYWIVTLALMGGIICQFLKLGN